MSNPEKLSILAVDDDADILMLEERMLNGGGLDRVVKCPDGRKVLDMLSEHTVGVMLLDLHMPGASGEALLPKIVEGYPEVPVIIVTGASDVDTAVRCMKLGAFDYVVKPFETQRLVSAVERALELHELRSDYAILKKRLLDRDLDRPEAFAAIRTISPLMRALFRYAETVARTSKPVLITGETGVGKELMAGAIHTLSARPGPYVAVNVAGVDDDVFSDTLYGHVRGSFTGADGARSGLLEQAANGTMFLDEIGDLSAISQVKLLRLLQEREYYPIGADVPKVTSARFLVATHRDLDAAQKNGQFRTDLYYRLQIHRIHIPPLRERLEDVPLLVEHFLAEAAATYEKKQPPIPDELIELLQTYSFPGNVRELEAMIYNAVAHHRSGKLSLTTFSHLMSSAPVPAGSSDAPVDTSQFIFDPGAFPTLKQATNYLVQEALRRAHGNQTLAAQLLGVTPSAMNKRISRSKAR